MRIVFTLLTLLLLSSFQLQAVDDKDLSIRQAINMAVRQQALTQRIAKVYLALNDNPYEPKFYQERDAAIEQFQSQLDQLKWYTPTNSTKQDIQRMKELWKAYKAVANWSINDEGATKLLALSEQILENSNDLFQSYLAYAHTLHMESLATPEMQDMILLMKNAGIQRMLTQRIMLYYLAAKQQIESNVSNRKLSESIAQYQASLDYSMNSTLNSTSIKQKLKIMSSNWKQLSIELGSFGKDKSQIKNMMDLADGLFTNADDIALLYEELGSKLSISNAINTSSYQNMLIQRIAKSYVASSQGHAYTNKYRRELMSSIDLFEEQMLSMTRSANATESFKEAVGVVKTMWKNYRKLVTQWDNIDELSIIKVLERAHIMMATCDQVSQEIQNYAKTIPDYKEFFVQDNGLPVPAQSNIAHQLHLAGLQRAYTQRLAIYCMMNALNLDAQLSQSRMQDIIGKYQTNNQVLLDSPLQSKAIKKTLNAAQKQWKTLETYLTNPKQENIEEMLEVSSQLFGTLDILNKGYEEYMDQLFMEKN
ncbi:MAG: type IV pili methyl-accepting chemotaxis transducer N-terminal domain-containing protein [Aureispira sp.]